MSYNPIPPRVWSRVQNQCTYGITDTSYNVYIPLTNQTVSQAQANYEDKLIYKGNILQYKGNSSRLTKSQKYTQLAKGFGPNRTKVFATQSQTYTNPNTTGLRRRNTQTYPYPNSIVGDPNNPSGPFQYNVPNPNGCSGVSIQDGGTLVCGTFANPCTGEIIRSGATSATICNPASASDVPGSSILCWNTQVQTWFPKPRYVMNNSTDKWPVNYKGFVSAILPTSPSSISAYTNAPNSIIISWNPPIPHINSYKIYRATSESGPYTLIVSVSSYTTSYTDTLLTNNTTYYYYVESIYGNCKSDSLIVSATPLPLYTTTGIINSSGSFIYFTTSTSTFGVQTGTITFNYVCNVEFTLVAGGSSGGYWSAISNYGSPGGGGGQILNSLAPFVVNAGSTSIISVGAGAPISTTFPSASGAGLLGVNTRITLSSSSYSGNITTTNSTYGGGGGGGAVNISWVGGGGSGSSGGVVGDGGAGGGGGALTTINTSGIVSISSAGNNGSNGGTSSAPNGFGGNGGAGKLGIDGNTYGGGGGGGATLGNATNGLGGTGGGGNGSKSNTPTQSTAGSLNTGGGGGGGTGDLTNPDQKTYSPNTGGSGVAIFKITLY